MQKLAFINILRIRFFVDVITCHTKYCIYKIINYE